MQKQSFTGFSFFNAICTGALSEIIRYAVIVTALREAKKEGRILKNKRLRTD